MNLLGQAGYQRIYELQAGILCNPNFMSRIELFSDTVITVLSKPFGHGFNYYYYAPGGYIDEANVYSNLISGTGLIGFLLFLYICIKLCRNFIAGVRGNAFEPVNQVAIIGIGTLILMLVGGFSNRYLFCFKIYTFMIWSILAACYCATTHLSSNRDSVNRTHQNETKK